MCSLRPAWMAPRKMPKDTSDSLWADLSDTARSKNLGSQPLKCIGHPLYQVRLACFSVSQVGLGLLVGAQCWKGDNPRGSDSISSSIKSGSGQAALGPPQDYEARTVHSHPFAICGFQVGNPTSIYCICVKYILWMRPRSGSDHQSSELGSSLQSMNEQA